MTTERIQPECFIEAIRNSESCYLNLDGIPVLIYNLSKELRSSIEHKITTIAIFLIKPQTTSLKERMRLRELFSRPRPVVASQEEMMKVFIKNY